MDSRKSPTPPAPHFTAFGSASSPAHSEQAKAMAAGGPSLSDAEFANFQSLLQRLAGIYLAPTKKALICGRLAKRLKEHDLSSYGDYFRLLSSGRDAHELQVAVDLLTTNETYFFREHKHFDFLRDTILRGRQTGVPFRIWSAACSSGEEPYSLAMLLADQLRSAPWKIFASDISTRMLERARRAQYPVERARNIPPAYLKAYCLKGVGSQEGTLAVDRALQAKVTFQQVNLNEPLPRLPEFDVIFLRNVMIYFDMDTKRGVVGRLLPQLKRGGYFLIGHSESLNGVTEALKPVSPSIYRKP